MTTTRLQGFAPAPFSRVMAPKRTSPAASSSFERKAVFFAMLTILVLILLLLALGTLPAWPYSRGWGYYPSGGLGLVVLILVILLLLGRI